MIEFNGQMTDNWEHLKLTCQIFHYKYLVRWSAMELPAIQFVFLDSYELLIAVQNAGMASALGTSLKEGR